MDTRLTPCRESNTSLDLMNLMGTVLSGVAYGVVFAVCTLVLCTNSTGFVPKLSWHTLMLCWLFLLATVSIALQIKWTLLAFVTQRQDVSPSAFIEGNINDWIYVMLNVLYVVINWSADGLLVFRFFCVFNRVLHWCILPAVLYFSSLVTGSLALRELASPGTTQNTNKLANWLVVYRTVSLVLCVVLTSLIASRIIIIHRRRGSGLCSPKSRLMDVTTMLVKSASLEAAFTLLYVTTVGLSSPLQNVFLPILGQVQVIAPMLIIYCVLRGRNAIAVLPSHCDLTKATLSLRINTAFSSSGLGCEYSASPTRSIRGFDVPRYPFLPPYAAGSSRDLTIAVLPPSPSTDPAHVSGVQKLSTQRTLWRAV
ncbi:hypothetical protein BC826DRAFT_1030495 [Russula brevipes]|nr:hypothetical protein BC826DRAFT_1030495 [Russula brevipes]